MKHIKIHNTKDFGEVSKKVWQQVYVLILVFGIAFQPLLPLHFASSQEIDAASEEVTAQIDTVVVQEEPASEPEPQPAPEQENTTVIQTGDVDNDTFINTEVNNNNTDSGITPGEEEVSTNDGTDDADTGSQEVVDPQIGSEQQEDQTQVTSESNTENTQEESAQTDTNNEDTSGGQSDLGETSTTTENGTDVNNTPTSTEEILENASTTPTSTDEFIDENTTSTATSTTDGLGQTATSTQDNTAEPEEDEQNLCVLPDNMLVNEGESTTSTSTPGGVGQNASSTDEVVDDQSGSENSIHNQNQGDVCNEVDSDSSSSGNTASNNNGNVIIDTGDVDSDTSVRTNVNDNKTNIADECTEGQDCSEVDPNATSTLNIISSENDAKIQNDIDSDSVSGENTADENTGNVDITTGDVEGDVNVSNYANNNVTGDGDVVVVDIYGNVEGTLDVAGIVNGDESASGILIDENFVDNSVRVSNSSSAYIRNDIDLAIRTGSNQASGNGGNVNITTGNANGTVNVFNHANNNITGDGFLYTIVNVFAESWVGDLILPNMERRSSNTTGYFEQTVRNNNTAKISNNLQIHTNTGENKADTDKAANITTGNSVAQTNSFDRLNTNIFGNLWDLIRIKVFGLWDGKVFGLPEGVEYITDGDEIIIFNNPLAYEEVMQFERSLEVENTNNVEIENNINVDLDTGNNTATENGGEVNINTGDAIGKINIVNQANNNYTGSDWRAATVNVFGRWFGNLYFGKPDLYVEETVSVASDPAGVGDVITYLFRFGNIGDGDATNVVITDDFAESIVRTSGVTGGTYINGGVSWDVGTLKPGDTGTLTYSVEVRNDMPQGTYEVSNSVEIAAEQGDRNPNNNFSGGTFIASNPPSGNSGGNVTAATTYRQQPGLPVPATLIIAKTNNAQGKVQPGDTVSYQLVLENVGDLPAYDTLVKDVMKDSLGREITDNFWDLGAVYGQEKIIIDYDVTLGEDAVSGIYINHVHAEGWNDTAKVWIGSVADSSIEVDGLDPSLVGKNQTEEDREGDSKDGSEEPKQEAKPAQNIAQVSGETITKGVVKGSSFKDSDNSKEDNGIEENTEEIKNLDLPDDIGIVLGVSDKFFGGPAGLLLKYFIGLFSFLLIILLLLLAVEQMKKVFERSSVFAWLKRFYQKFKELASTSLFDLF